MTADANARMVGELAAATLDMLQALPEGHRIVECGMVLSVESPNGDVETITHSTCEYSHHEVGLFRSGAETSETGELVEDEDDEAPE